MQAYSTGGRYTGESALCCSLRGVVGKNDDGGAPGRG
jgi:hypothetical protein